MNQILLSLFLLLTAHQWTYAEEYLELNEVGFSKLPDPFQARRAIQEEIIKQVSLRYIAELIGEPKTTKNKDLILAKVVKDYGRYIPYVKVGRLEVVKEGRQMPVTLKISLKNLKQILLQNGLLYEQEGPAIVLPMVSLTDKIHLLNYRWWVGETDKSKTFLVQQITAFHRELARALKNQGFFLRNPTANGDRYLVPQTHQIDALRMEDLVFLGEFFKAQIIVKGDIRIDQKNEGSEIYHITVRISALHTANGRVVAEVVRSINTEPGVFQTAVSNKLELVFSGISQDLALQMYETWQKGTFGTRLIKLTVRGPIEFYQLNKFKTQVEQKIGEIKSIRERLFEPSQVTFEIDSSVGVESLAEKLKKSRFDGFSLVLDGIKAETMAIVLSFE